MSSFPAVGLDLGSSRTRCAVCLVEDERLRFLGYGECESRGWVKSRVADRGAVWRASRTSAERRESNTTSATNSFASSSAAWRRASSS